MLVLLHVVIGCGILFRFKVYQNLYSEQRAHPFFSYYGFKKYASAYQAVH